MKKIDTKAFHEYLRNRGHDAGLAVKGEKGPEADRVADLHKSSHPVAQANRASWPKGGK